jgi:hypothetical protein
VLGKVAGDSPDITFTGRDGSVIGSKQYLLEGDAFPSDIAILDLIPATLEIVQTNVIATSFEAGHQDLLADERTAFSDCGSV